MTLAAVKQLVREHCGLTFGDAREGLLAEGVRTRLSKRGLASLEEYAALLARDPEEVRRLVSLVTVNETYFFREAAHFSVLVDRLVPELWSSRGGRDKLKIVCAGCSTGEEPYTVAIALHERFGPAFARRFTIVGFDIDEAALEKARQGWYAAHSFRGVPQRIRDTYFEAVDGGHRLVKACRDAVSFAHQNICDGAYPDFLGDADVVFYRNVSIYFEPGIQQRIFRNLAGLLHERGYLFVSSTETFCHNIGVLSLVERDDIFFYAKRIEVPIGERRTAAAGAPAAPRPDAAPRRPAPRAPAVRSREEPHRLFDEALRLAAAKDYAAALERLAALKPAFAAAALLKTKILVNCKRFDEARSACQEAVAQDRWCLEGHLFLGLIAKIQGDLAAARQHFKEALYVQPSCWVAHFHLGEIHRCAGESERAAREYQLVIDQLQHAGAAAHGLEYFSFSFSAAQIVHLCRHNLDAMKSTVR
jgi:chemotaxis protein methyltransferase CheR